MFWLPSKSNVHITKVQEKLRSKKCSIWRYRNIETMLTDKCKALSSGRNQRLMNEEVKCDMHVRLNHLLKDMQSEWNFEGKLMQRFWLLLYSAPAWVHTTSTQQLVKQLWVTLPCTCRTRAVVMFSMPLTSDNLYILPVLAQGCGLSTTQRWSFTNTKMMSGRFVH